MQQPTRKLYVTVDVSYGDIVVNAFQKVNMSNKHWGGGEGGRKHGSCSQAVLFIGTNSLLFIASTRAGMWLDI